MDKFKLVGIRMTEELHRRLKIKAAENSTTMQGIIQEALDVYEKQQAECNLTVGASEK